ncbi:Bifunctional arginine demethylase and lysyl-hydroxylase JMJD6, partial [Durusdinium trenchii]
RDAQELGLEVLRAPGKEEYPEQNDEESLVVDLKNEELTKEEERMEEKALEVMEQVQSGIRTIKVGDYSTRVKQLGNLLFKDGAMYEAASNLSVPINLLRDAEYNHLWYLQKMHDQFFQSFKHKRYIPRLDQPISRLEFHQLFRQTSTPVIIPFKHMRHLGFLTKGWTLDKLRERFPYSPTPGSKRLHYNAKSGLNAKNTLDLGPALYELSKDAKLAKGTGTQRNFPRNLMLRPKYLAMLNISYPPFVPKRRFQVPTLWMGTSSADTESATDPLHREAPELVLGVDEISQQPKHVQEGTRYQSLAQLDRDRTSGR